MRAVKREVPRLRLRHAGAVVRARVVLRHLDLVFRFSIHRRDDHAAAAEPRGCLDRIHEPRPLVRSDRDAVDHHLDVVLLVLVHRDGLADLVQAPVHPNPHEARLADVLDE